MRDFGGGDDGGEVEADSRESGDGVREKNLTIAFGLMGMDAVMTTVGIIEGCAFVIGERRVERGREAGAGLMGRFI